MASRTFTVFQDAPSSQVPQPKPVTRQNAMMTRSATLNMTSSVDVSSIADLVALDKENVNPVTGERASATLNASKKRKTSVLAAKVQPPATKAKKEKDSQNEPEKKRRKASSSAASTSKAKSATKNKASGSSTKKTTTKRASSRKQPALPRVIEEAEVEKPSLTQGDINARCYELTVKPLADVSDAYEEPAAFAMSPADDNAKYATVKAASAEPELRDYEDPRVSFSSVMSRPSMFSDLPESRTFSTPERKKIYAAFTFSSPSGSGGRLSKEYRSASVSSFEAPITDLL